MQEKYHLPPQDFVTILWDAFENQKSDIQIRGEGVVIRLLSDDLVVPRHQRFIIRISPKQTLLVAHNIDIADRVSNLQIDSTIEFYGEYAWNAEGGVIHWTHHDPRWWTYRWLAKICWNNISVILYKKSFILKK